MPVATDDEEDSFDEEDFLEGKIEEEKDEDED